MADPTLLPWAAALGAGLLIGMERERRQPPESPAGLRSFVLASLSGATAAVLGPLALAVVLAAFALLTFSGYAQTRKSDPGLTTEFALLLTVLIGALAQQTPGWAAGLAVVVAGILAAKNMLHSFVRNVLSTQEMESALLLAAAALVVLPLLPDQRIVWLAGLNLHTLWLLAVLVMVIQSLGHIAVRALGSQRGLALSGLAGGFVSSTATIASMAQRARLDPAARPDCLRAALLSNAATVLELSALVALIEPTLLPGLLPAVGLYGAGALLAVGAMGRSGPRAGALSDASQKQPPDSLRSPPLQGAASSEPTPLRAVQSGAGQTGAAALSPEGVSVPSGRPRGTDMQPLAAQRPFQPLYALLFAAILAGVLLVAEVARGWLGGSGAIAATGLAGFADAHAAAASAAQLAANGSFTPLQALLTMALALSTNAVSKVVAGFAGAQWIFGAVNAAVQVVLISLFWLGLWLGTFMIQAQG